MKNPFKAVRQFFTGPVGPIGAHGTPGKCECEPRVAELERRLEKLTNSD